MSDAPWLFYLHFVFKKWGQDFDAVSSVRDFKWLVVTQCCKDIFVVLFKLPSAINVIETDAMQTETGTH